MAGKESEREGKNKREELRDEKRRGGRKVDRKMKKKVITRPKEKHDNVCEMKNKRLKSGSGWIREGATAREKVWKEPTAALKRRDVDDSAEAEGWS